MRLAVATTIAVSLALASCTGGGSKSAATSAPKKPTVQLSGTVLDDASPPRPVAGAKVQAGAEAATTAADGSFTLKALSPGESISVEQCAHAPVTLTAPSKSGTQEVTLQALPINGTVMSNLTHKGIVAHVAGAQSGDTVSSGKFSLEGPCPGDTLKVTANGYTDGTATIDDSRTVKVTLQADPATTEIQEVAWDAAQNAKAECQLVHPDAHAYISFTGCIAYLKGFFARGIQDISVKVHSVTYITWTFPRCSGANFGPKTYHHVAALNYTVQQTAASGGKLPISAIARILAGGISPSGRRRPCSARPAEG